MNCTLPREEDVKMREQAEKSRRKPEVERLFRGGNKRKEPRTECRRALRELSNFLSLLLFQCDSVSPGRPLNIRTSAMGSAKAIMAAGWAPDGLFSACP